MVRLLIGGIVVEVLPGGLLLSIFHGVMLVDAWTIVGRVAAESNVEHLQKVVHAGEHGLGRNGGRLDRGRALVDDHTIWIREVNKWGNAAGVFGLGSEIGFG